MAKKGHIDDSGFKRKMEKLRKIKSMFENIHLDAAQKFGFRLSNQVINGQYVNVISGNLRRSHGLRRRNKSVTEVGSNLSSSKYKSFVGGSAIAPYRPEVMARTRAKYGKTYLRIAQDAYLPEIREAAREEYKRAIRIIEKGGDYKYENPFGVR